MNMFINIMEDINFLNILESINTPNKYLISPFIIFIGGYHYFTRRKLIESDVKINTIKTDNENYINQKEKELSLIKQEIYSLKELNKSLSYDNEKLKEEIYELNENIKMNENIISEKDKLIIISNEKLEEIYKQKLKENKIKEKNHNGDGVLRYKNKESTIYYHGMGHLENNYTWWKPYMNRKICFYKNKNRKLNFTDFETHDIYNFCKNCEYCDDLNKNKRNTFYYECKGHKINVD